MGSVEKKLKPCPTCAAPCEYEVKMRGGDYGWSTTDEQRTFYKFNAAALRERAEARGVVDAEKLARLISEWELHDRTFGHDGRHPLIADFRAILTAAQQPGQEGGGERKGCGDPTCGCDWPSFTEPMEALRFLSGRMKYAGIAEGVARSYARDIDDILAKHDTAPPSAPVGVEGLVTKWRGLANDALRRSGTWGGNDIADRIEFMADELEALTQQPAQAAPGDGIDWRWKYEDRRALVSHWHAEAVRLGYDGVADLLACVEKGEPPTHIADVLARAATPPGDDAAGGAA